MLPLGMTVYCYFILEPPKIIETFDPWIPIRSGSSTKASEFHDWFRKPDSEHYIPDADHRNNST